MAIKNKKANKTQEQIQAPKAEDKKEVGRPTLFKPEFCKLLCEHMAKGYSYGTFGAYLFNQKLVSRPIGRSTLYEWESQFQDWAEAKELAKDLSQLWWETLSIDYSVNEFQGASLNSTNLIFNMKNRFSDFAKGMDDTNVNINVTGMSNDELKQIVSGYLDQQVKIESSND